MKKLLTGIVVSGISTLLLSTAMAAAPATLKVQTTKPIYSWRTETEKDKSGKFDHCLVKNMYDNGTLMILAQNNTGEKRIALNFPQTKMQEGQHFDLTIQIDRRDIFPVEAVAINTETLAIGIPEALPDQMRKGQLLHLRGPNDEVVYTLDGMGGAVMALQDCVLTQKNKPATTMVAANDIPKEVVPEVKPVTAPLPEDNEMMPEAKQMVSEKPAKALTAAKAKAVVAENKPVPAITNTLDNPLPDKIIPPAAPVVASASTMNKLADKIKFLQDNKVIEVATDPGFPQPWQGIFAGSDYAPDRLIPMKNKTPDQPLDYIWKKADIFIGVKAKNVKPGEALAIMSNDYLKMLKTRCAGNFIAEATATQPSAKTGITWQVAEAACSNSSNGDSIAAMIFAFTPQGGEIYFFESSADKGAGAIKARDTILNKVLQ